MKDVKNKDKRQRTVRQKASLLCNIIPIFVQIMTPKSPKGDFTALQKSPLGDLEVMQRICCYCEVFNLYCHVRI